MTRRVGACAAIVWMLAASPVARADGDATDREARELYYAGDNHYAAGRYEEALRSFERAYELSKRPQLLYNIANAYERMGDYDKAADYLRRYLESPEAEDVSSVRERIKRLEMNAQARRDTGSASAASAPAVESTQPPATLVAAPPQTDPAASRRPAYLMFAGAGAAFVTSGLFGLASRSAGSSAAELCNDDGLCPASADDNLHREKRFAIVADVTAGVGIAAVGVGIYLLVRERRPERGAVSALDVAPSLDGDGVGLSLSGRF